MHSLGNIIGNKSHHSLLMRGVAGAMAVEEASRLLISIFGSTASNTCQVMPIKNRVLLIACLSSVLEDDIKKREKEIVNSINRKIGECVVEKIRFLA